jgi:hypothetical protein
MKTAALLSALVFATGVALVPVASYAAHAGAPYQNVDRKTDKGNDTGDAKVDELNDAQLNKNYHGQNPGDQGGMAPAPMAAPMAPGGARMAPMSPAPGGMPPN